MDYLKIAHPGVGRVWEEENPQSYAQNAPNSIAAADLRGVLAAFRPICSGIARRAGIFLRVMLSIHLLSIMHCIKIQTVHIHSHARVATYRVRQ